MPGTSRGSTGPRSPRICHVSSKIDVHAPAVTIVGWIPYRQLGTILNPAWRNHPKQTAFRNLFRTGNAPDPPEHLGGANLHALVGSKNFRATLAVNPLRLHGDR